MTHAYEAAESNKRHNPPVYPVIPNLFCPLITYISCCVYIYIRREGSTRGQPGIDADPLTWHWTASQHTAPEKGIRLVSHLRVYAAACTHAFAGLKARWDPCSQYK